MQKKRNPPLDYEPKIRRVTLKLTHPTLANIGGEFLIDQDLHIIVSLSNNRQINSYEMTDFDWYLSKIIPILKAEKIYIESVVFSQYN